MSSGQGGVVGDGGSVDFADDGSFEAAEDVFAVQALVGAALPVVAGGLVVAESDQGDGVQGVVGGAVAAAVEAVAVGAAAAGGYGCGAAEVGEGGFVAEPVGVV